MSNYHYLVRHSHNPTIVAETPLPTPEVDQ